MLVMMVITGWLRVGSALMQTLGSVLDVIFLISFIIYFLISFMCASVLSLQMGGPFKGRDHSKGCFCTS